MSRVFWDTSLFVYLFEGYGDPSKQVISLRQAMLARGDQLLTSTLTLGEILVKPVQQGDEELARKYENAIAGSALLLAFDVKAEGSTRRSSVIARCGCRSLYLQRCAPSGEKRGAHSVH